MTARMMILATLKDQTMEGGIKLVLIWSGSNTLWRGQEKKYAGLAVDNNVYAHKANQASSNKIYFFQKVIFSILPDKFKNQLNRYVCVIFSSFPPHLFSYIPKYLLFKRSEFYPFPLLPSSVQSQPSWTELALLSLFPSIRPAGRLPPIHPEKYQGTKIES